MNRQGPGLGEGSMTFRILSLDGGGTWSLIQVMALIDLYRSGGALLTGHHVLRDFDLAVADSGGSLVLGGLLKDLPLTEILKWFEDVETRRALLPRLPRMGSSGSRLARRLSGVAPRYSGPRKLSALRALLNTDAGEPGLGDVTLDAAKTRLRLSTQILLTAFDYDRGREVFFRSNPKSRAASFATPAIATIAEAIHASTQSPIDYFDGPAAVSRGRRCWDGAVAGFHNPVLAGIAEVLANGVEASAIRVLSIGSGGVVLPLAGGNEDFETAKLVQPRPRPGRAGDLRRLAAAMIEDPPDPMSLIAHLTLGQAVPASPDASVATGTLVRMNPLLQPIRTPGGWVRPAGLNEADEGGDEFLRLRQIAYDTVDEGEIALIRKFCRLWLNDAVVNQPIRANADTFDCEIGHRWYSEAKAQWQTLMEPPATAPGHAGGHGDGRPAGPPPNHTASAHTVTPSVPPRATASSSRLSAAKRN